MQEQTEGIHSSDEVVSSSPVPHYGVRRPGASHMRDGKSCQDAFAITLKTQDQTVFVMAVADGHGSQAYDLSQVGSDVAVKVATEILQQYAKSFESKERLWSGIKNHFPTDVLRAWRKEITKDFTQRSESLGQMSEEGEGLQEVEEPDGLSEEGHPDLALSPQEKESLERAEKVYKRYGTTLLAMMVTREGLFFCQLGDGDILLLDGEEKVEAPIQISEVCMGNQTFSMVSRDSIRLWRIQMVSIDAPVFVMMSSDGLSNSFEDTTQFHKFAKSLYKNIRAHGLEETVKILPDWLDKASKNGSGDDITLTFAVIDPSYFQMSKQNQEIVRNKKGVKEC